MSMFKQQQCQGASAGADWHSVKGRTSEEKHPVSPRSTLSMISKPLAAPRPRTSPVKTLAAKAGNMRRKKSTNPVRRRTWRDITAGDAVDYGYKAWNLAKRISTLINVEEKVHDVDGSGGIQPTTTASVVNLSNIAQGTDYFNRVGDSILVQSMEFRATASGNTSTSGQRMRVMIVCDREQNGTDPVIGEILQAGTSPLTQPYNVFYEQRFSILFDQLISFNNRVGLATSGTSTTFLRDRLDEPIDFVRKWNKHIKYDASAAADASNRENALYLIAISDEASDGPSLNYTFRLRFTDN